ncbi:hypothetical protein N7456_001711 [Penicillium angulare]|uniref:Uncharacterized protein n=1 Tax=Penicillium angulare TaxID=116970 RepID=A0A9W9KPJ4_9EURO|nr:hypothetical protein N7456_001711 [Penicillium angulare]
MGPPAAGAPGDNRSDGSTTVKDDKESKANKLHEWELYRLHEWELYRLHEWELFLVGVEHFHRQQALKRKQAKKIAYKQAKEEERACKKQQTAQKVSPLKHSLPNHDL